MYYYYNAKTGESSWIKPKLLGTEDAEVSKIYTKSKSEQQLGIAYQFIHFFYFWRQTLVSEIVQEDILDANTSSSEEVAAQTTSNGI